MDKCKVVIGMATAAPEPTFVQTYGQMLVWDSVYGSGYFQHDRFSIFVKNASVVANARNEIVKAFLGFGPEYEWLLFIDDDQPVPADLIEQLMQDVHAVEDQGASCKVVAVPVWRFDGKSVQEVYVTHNVFDVDDRGITVPREDPLPTKGQIEPIAAIGPACMLIHRDALTAVRMASMEAGQGGDLCWFRHTFWPVSEDEGVYFCRLLARAGIAVWLTGSLGVIEHIKRVRLTKEVGPGELVI